MKPEASIRKTWCGAADAVAAGSPAGRSATTLIPTSSICTSRRVLRDLADLTRRRAFVLPLLARNLGRRHDHPGSLGYPAGPHDGAIDEQARAIGALDPARRRQVQIHPRVAEHATVAPLATSAGSHHLVDLNGLERGHQQSGKYRRPGA